jgi:hypothetical protein
LECVSVLSSSNIAEGLAQSTAGAKRQKSRFAGGNAKSCEAG